MQSSEGSHRTAFSLMLLVVVAIGLHVYALRVKEVKPSRQLPRTSLSPNGQGRMAGSQSSRIQRVLKN